MPKTGEIENDVLETATGKLPISADSIANFAANMQPGFAGAVPGQKFRNIAVKRNNGLVDLQDGPGHLTSC